MRGFTVGFLFSLAASAATCGVASAQEIGEKGSAPTPLSDVEKPKGSSGGPDADVSVAAGYDDNIFATKNDKVDDIIVLVEPYVSYRFTGGSGDLKLRASGEAAFHDRNPGEDYDDWLLGADGQLNLAKQVQFLAGGSYQWEHESRASPEDVAGSEPTLYRRAYGYTGLVGRRGRMAFRLGATLADYDFSDTPATGGTIANDDRDRRETELGARLGYRLAGGPELFVQGLWDKRHYHRKVDDWGYRRASEGFSLAGGVRHEFASGLSGEIFAGLLQQDYDDPALSDIHTVDYGMLVRWSGERNLSASFRLDRSIGETTLPGASAYVLTSGIVSVEALAGPRLLVGASLSGTNYDYRGAPRSEFVIDADLWTRYWIDRHLFVGASYTFGQRASNAAGYDYDQNRFMLRLGAQLHPRYEGAGKDSLSGGGEALKGVYFAALLGHVALATGLDGPRGTGSNTADFGDVDTDIGIALGYGARFDRLYLGFEVEGFGGGADWRHGADRAFSIARTGSLGASLRLGRLTAHDDLIYGRAGVVSSKFHTTYLSSDTDLDSKGWRTGLGFGLGLEAALGTHGFVRTEYDLVAYPDYDIPPDAADADNFSNSENRFRVGVGVRFGGNPEPKGEPVDFSGVYGGISLGHGALTSSNQGPRSSGETLDVTRSGQGSILGIFAGLGTVVQGFYLGGEVHGDAAHLDWNIERDPQGRVYSVAHDYSYGASARLGRMLSPSALLYGRVGAVRTRFDTHYATTGTSVRERNWETGLQYGLGLQLGLGRKSNLRLEYAFTDYPKYALAYGHSSDDFENYENSVRVGMSWTI